MPAPDIEYLLPLLGHLPGAQQAAGPDTFHSPLSRRPGWAGSPEDPAKMVTEPRVPFPWLRPCSPTNVSLEAFAAALGERLTPKPWFPQARECFLHECQMV